jgi:hypothetical protein
MGLVSQTVAKFRNVNGRLPGETGIDPSDHFHPAVSTDGQIVTNTELDDWERYNHSVVACRGKNYSKIAFTWY